MEAGPPFLNACVVGALHPRRLDSALTRRENHRLPSHGCTAFIARQTRLVHHFVPNENPVSSSESSAHAAAIRRWTREYLTLSEDAVITVTESPCIDPGCPLAETTIAIFEPSQTRSWRFTRPKVALTKAMVQQALASTATISTAVRS